MCGRARRMWLPVAAALLVATTTSAQVLPGLPPTEPQADAPAAPQAPSDNLTALRAGLERSIELVRRVTQRAGAAGNVNQLAETLPDFAAMARALIEAGAPDNVGGSPLMMQLLAHALEAADQRLTRWQAGLVLPSESIETALTALSAEDRNLEAAEARAAADGLPGDVAAALDRVRGQITRAINQARDRQLEMVRLQAEMSALAIEIDQAVDDLAGRIEADEASRWRLDGPPIWQAGTSSQPAARPAPSDALPASLVVAGEPTSAGARAGRFVAEVLAANLLRHVGTYVAFVVLLLLIGRRGASWWQSQSPALRHLAAVVRRPYSAALLPTLMVAAVAGGRIQLGSTLLLFPLLRVVPHLLPAGYQRAVWLLSAILLVDLATDAGAGLSLATRVLQLVLIAVTAGGLVWLMGRLRVSALDPRWRRATILGAWLALALLAGAFVAEVVGALGLARYLEHGVTSTVFGATLLYAFVLMSHGVLQLLIEPAGVRLMALVPEGSADLARRLSTGIRWMALVFFGLLVIEAFQLTAPALALGESQMARTIVLGAISINAGSVVILIAIVAGAVVASRVVRFFLSAVYARVSLAARTGVIVSKLVHYALLTAGTLVGFGAAGIELSRFTVLMGALGVGIGFGLQNIVGNFISGLILLFERPLNVGDNIMVGDISGRVVDVGIRGTRIHTWEGADVTVPNSNLVSGEFTNWSLSDDRRRSDLAVGVAYGTDPARVTRILSEVAAGHAHVLKDPAPEVLFAAFGDNSLKFVVRYWTLVGDFVAVSSDLHRAVYERLTAEKIAIPFPQRDIHLRSVPAEPRARATEDPGPGLPRPGLQDGVIP